MNNTKPSIKKAGKRGGKRPGSGRKPGAKNKATAVRIQAADKLLDRSHGKPAVNIEPVEINISPIPWGELREISRKSIEEAERRHREIIEGRYERLGIKQEYYSD